MNKRITFMTILILSMILLFLLGMGLYLSNSIAEATKGEYLWASKEPADYHVMVILDKSNQTYDQSFNEGLKQSSEDYKIAVEIVMFEGENVEDEVINNMDLAVYAKADGVIVHAYDNPKIINKIDELMELGIAVITLNEDLPQSDRVSYVGVNRYKIGLEAGEALAKATGGIGKIAVIEQQNYQKLSHQQQDILLLGITDALRDYPGLSLELVRYTKQGLLNAEILATEIARNHPEINGIFCTNAENTLGVVQVLVDNNLVNRISLVGYGDDDEILGYIERGKIIESSVVTDYKDIGKEALKVFYEYKTNSYVPSYINTALQVIDEENIAAYITEKSEAYEKNQ